MYKRQPLQGVTTKVYDPDGNMLSVTTPDSDTLWAADGKNHTTQNTYDVFNRLATTTDPNGITTSFGYDSNGNRVSVTDGNQHVSQFTYDGLKMCIRDSVRMTFKQNWSAFS